MADSHVNRAGTSYPATICADDSIPKAAIKALDYVLEYFDVTVEGAERIPEGGSLLVGNHSHFGIDSLAFFPALYGATGRIPRGMALRSLFGVPGLKWLMHQLGAVEGTRSTCIDLLDSDEMVVTYPGGAKDSIKGKDDRYTLKWGERQGFADVAIRAQKPIVPFAAIGPDEVFPVLNNRGLVSAPFLGDKSYKVPILIPIARRVPFYFHIGEPISPPDISDVDDPWELVAIRRDFAESAREALEELIGEGLEARRERRRQNERRGRRGLIRDAIAALLP
ncbi:lysophospholipid acyltransferase family protein [Persicimonas caeni]|uniref:lysophospholipid acyltransferase family protein n=1 Tax=Persicimonas caeni TaxID=2292766 RepID=UPI00143D1738|nr:lysophospholipid acyltransferase family protein [Persicimonas caeni]